EADRLAAGGAAVLGGVELGHDFLAETEVVGPEMPRLRGGRGRGGGGQVAKGIGLLAGEAGGSRQNKERSSHDTSPVREKRTEACLDEDLVEGYDTVLNGQDQRSLSAGFDHRSRLEGRRRDGQLGIRMDRQAGNGGRSALAVDTDASRLLG